LEFINSHDVTLLMVGSDDGSIRVWKNYYNMFGREPTLLTAWQALADLQPVVRGSTGT
jgi:regulator-associated protein of mTOR